MQTLVQLNKTLLEIAKNHLQISSYGFGSASHFEEALMIDESLFPCMWVELADFNGAESSHSRNINIHITDTNKDQVLAFSKTEQICLDVLHMLRIQYEENNMSVIKNHNMVALAYRGVDHSHGFQISIEIQYGDPYDACAAPSEIPDYATCFKVWSNTQKKWNEDQEVWDLAGLPTNVELFEIVPTNYPHNEPEDIVININVSLGCGTDMSYIITGSNGYNSGVNTKQINSFVDVSKPTTNTVYSVVVTFKDEQNLWQNIGEQAVLTVTPSTDIGYSGYSGNGTDIPALIEELENPSNIGANPAQQFEAQSETSFIDGFTINPGAVFKYHVIVTPDNYTVTKIKDASGIDVTSAWTKTVNQNVGGNQVTIYTIFVSGGLPTNYTME